MPELWHPTVVDEPGRECEPDADRLVTVAQARPLDD
jgi:hypothetical protein